MIKKIEIILIPLVKGYNKNLTHHYNDINKYIKQDDDNQKITTKHIDCYLEYNGLTEKQIDLIDKFLEKFS